MCQAREFGRCTSFGTLPKTTIVNLHFKIFTFLPVKGKKNVHKYVFVEHKSDYSEFLSYHNLLRYTKWYMFVAKCKKHP